jgi:hypothetical protein
VPPNARFWTFDILRAHRIEWEKLNVYQWGVSAFPHRVVLYALAPMAWVWTAQRPEPALQRFAKLWIVFLVVACGPALSAYVKSFGSWNNLGIFDVWSALALAPVLWFFVTSSKDADAAAPARALYAAATGLSIVLVSTVIPTRAWPSAANYAAARELEAELTRAHAAHERVLVAHGTAALIHAGYRDVPLDRANSIVELLAGHEISRVSTGVRLHHRDYDRIYLNMADWLATFWPLIALGYDPAGMLLAPSAREEANGSEQLGDRFGYQQVPPFMDQAVHILKKKPAP